MYKCIRNLTSLNLHFDNCNWEHVHNARFSNNSLLLPMCNTEMYQRSFMISGPKYWNTLLGDIKY